MLEKVYKYDRELESKVTKLIMDETVHYIHMMFQKDEGLPEHISNANLYMTVVEGTLSIGLGDQDIHRYEKGSVLNIPQGIKMNVGNKDDGKLELIVLKTPAPTK